VKRESEGSVVPAKRVTTVEGRDPGSDKLFPAADETGIDVSLPDGATKLEELQEKLYAKAKAEPTFRFYTLYDKVYRADVLEEAYRRAKANRGSPGVDGQTFEQIEESGRERWLGKLREELAQETYRPEPVRRVMIPKVGGGERPLGIPTIKDRVAQTAAKLILEPIFEADFRDEAYGYRPGRSALDAVRVVHRELKKGHTQVLDADLSKYFDTIPHAELMTSVARRIADGRVLHLVKMWLKTPVQEKDEQGRLKLSGGAESKQGTPQGGVISPLLANIYINRLLKAFAQSDLGERRGAKIVNYADDFVVVSRKGANEVLERVKQWVPKLGLKLNEQKTCIRDARKESFKFLGYDFGPMVNHRTGKSYVGVRVSKKALISIREKVSEKLRPGRTEPWEEIRDELNRMLVGWANYFWYGSPVKAFGSVDTHVAERARNFLRRRHKKPRGTACFNYHEVHERYGLVDVRTLLRPHASG
jgi:RNA-directed DNA polymerase